MPNFLDFQRLYTAGQYESEVNGWGCTPEPPKILRGGFAAILE